MVLGSFDNRTVIRGYSALRHRLFVIRTVPPAMVH